MFSLRPRLAPLVDDRATTFEGIVESDAPRTPVVAEVQDEPSRRWAMVEDDVLLSRIAVSYEDDNGTPLGTAPPPAGIARVASPPTPEPQPSDDSFEPPKGVKPAKPPKGAIEPPKLGKGTTKPPYPGGKGDK